MPSGQEGIMSGLTVSGSPRIGAMVRPSFTAMTPAERTRMTAMYGAIAGLHVLGFFILFAFVVSSHYEELGIGLAILAYTLGLRHAFHADHISAIDKHHPQGAGRTAMHGQAAPVRLLLLPRPFQRGRRDRGRHHRRGEDRLPRHLLVHRRHRGPQPAHPPHRRV